jgi:hypothetical protein
MKEVLDAIDRFIQRQPEELRQTFVQPNELPRFRAETQYWGKPYDERYLLLTFPTFAFQLTDLFVLSKTAAVPDDGGGDVIDFIPAPQLRDGTWLTTCGLSGLGDSVYLHFYFLGKDTRIQHTSHRIALKGLPERPGPEIRDGVVRARHPRISPTAISPQESATAMREGSAKPLAAPALGGGQPPYTRMFLSFDGWTFPQINCWPVDGRVESDDYLALSDKDPVSPTDHFKNGYCYISNLTEDIYYNFMTWAMTWGASGWQHQKYHNANFWTLDFDTAAGMRMWYVRWQNGAWVRVGDVVRFRTDYSSWMQDIRGHIGGKKLYQIAIPGTHDSGCFDLYAKGATATFSQSQDLDFPGQLRYGVRYFDLRLYLAEDGHYYFNHGTTKTYTRIDDFVAALATFMGSPNNKEIVIADLSRFGQGVGANFQPSDYEKILKLFTTNATLGPLLTNGAHETSTIDTLMNGNKRLVLLCDKSPDGWFKTICASLGIVVHESINLEGGWANTSQL